MRLAGFQQRLGLGDEPPDPGFAQSIVLAAVLLYAVAFFAFYPNVMTNDDESTYLDHAQILVQGSTQLVKHYPLTGEEVPYRTGAFDPLGYYPVGTALLMVPFVAAFGWKGAYLVPMLALVCGVLVITWWLRDDGRSPLFALLALSFPASLVMGRVGMSDVPSFAVVALGLWLFWRGLDGDWRPWLASGFVAGASLMFRDTNAVLFAPLFFGTVLRREFRCWALILGGSVGLALKFATSYLAFGEVFYFRSEYLLAIDTMGGPLSIFMLGLVVFVPGGYLLALAYRGRRRPEVVATLLLFVAMFAIQSNTTYSTGLLKRLILDWRYMVPLLPLLVFAMSEAVPRLWGRLLESRDAAQRHTLKAAAGLFLLVWICGVAAAVVGVHVAFAGWSATQAIVRDAIETTIAREAVIVTNLGNTRKFIGGLERPYVPLDRDEVGASDVEKLVARYDPVYLAFLDRTDAELRLEDAARNAEFVSALTLPVTLEYDRQISRIERLRIWRMESRNGSGAAANPGTESNRPLPKP